MKSRLVIGRAALVVLHCVFVAFAGHALAQTTERVSVATSGAQADSPSMPPAISGDGRFVAFVSRATNLDPVDANHDADVWLRDLATNTTELVSVTPGGASGDRGSYQPSLSADGRRVAFTSRATNLVAGDGNDRNDVYVRDRRTGGTLRVSLGVNGVEVREHCESPSISADGRHVAFHSWAANLVPNDTNGEADVYVRDLATDALERVSVGTGGVEGHGPAGATSALSADGRYVAFTSFASNLVAGDTNGNEDVYLRDRRTGTTVRVGVASDGAQADFDARLAGMSADGRYVAFVTRAALVLDDTNAADDAYVRDVVARTTVRVSIGSSGVQGDSDSSTASISADGRFVAFASWSTNFAPQLPAGRSQIHVRDRLAATTTLVSVANSAAIGNDDSTSPAVSADGRRIAYLSFATNLVAFDDNTCEDVFVHDRGVAFVRAQPRAESGSRTPTSVTRGRSRWPEAPAHE